jgi:predicted PhzF superfamily epimerase YddE/YHI9
VRIFGQNAELPFAGHPARHRWCWKKKSGRSPSPSSGAPMACSWR